MAARDQKTVEKGLKQGYFMILLTDFKFFCDTGSIHAAFEFLLTFLHIENPSNSICVEVTN